MRIGLRLAALGAIVGLMFTLLVLRLWVLQVTDIAVALETAEGQTLRTVILEAPRGDIYDRDGNVLASSVLVFAGRTPYTVDGTVPGGRDAYIQWLQDQPDQPGIVRN